MSEHELELNFEHTNNETTERLAVVGGNLQQLNFNVKQNDLNESKSNIDKDNDNEEVDRNVSFGHTGIMEDFPFSKLGPKPDIMSIVMKRRLGNSSNENSPVKKRKTDSDDNYDSGAGAEADVSRGGTKQTSGDETDYENPFRSEDIGFHTGIDELLAEHNKTVDSATKSHTKLYSESDSDSEDEAVGFNLSNFGSLQPTERDIVNNECMEQSLKLNVEDRSGDHSLHTNNIFDTESHNIENIGLGSQKHSVKSRSEITLKIPPTVYKKGRDSIEEHKNSRDHSVSLTVPSAVYKKKKDSREETLKANSLSVKLKIPPTFFKTGIDSEEDLQKSNDQCDRFKILPVEDEQNDWLEEESRRKTGDQTQNETGTEDADETDGDTRGQILSSAKPENVVLDEKSDHILQSSLVLGAKKSRKQVTPKRLIKHLADADSESKTDVSHTGKEMNKESKVLHPDEIKHKIQENPLVHDVFKKALQKVETYCNNENVLNKSHEKSRKQSVPKRIIDNKMVASQGKDLSLFDMSESHLLGRVENAENYGQVNKPSQWKKCGMTNSNTITHTIKSENSKKLCIPQKSDHTPEQLVHIPSVSHVKLGNYYGNKDQLETADSVVNDDSQDSSESDNSIDNSSSHHSYSDNLSPYFKNLGPHTQSSYASPDLETLSQQIALQAEILAKLSQNHFQKTESQDEFKASTLNESLAFVRKLREIRFNKYRKIAISEKKHIASFAKIHGVSAAANYFGVSKSAVSLWTRTDFKETDEELAKKKRNCMIGNEKFETLVKRVKQEKCSKFKNLSKEDKIDVVKYAKLVGVREMSRCLDIALGTVSGWMRQFPYAIKKRTDENVSGDETSKGDVSDIPLERKNENKFDLSEKSELSKTGDIVQTSEHKKTTVEFSNTLNCSDNKKNIISSIPVSTQVTNEYNAIKEENVAIKEEYVSEHNASELESSVSKTELVSENKAAKEESTVIKTELVSECYDNTLDSYKITMTCEPTSNTNDCSFQKEQSDFAINSPNSSSNIGNNVENTEKIFNKPLNCESLKDLSNASLEKRGDKSESENLNMVHSSGSIKKDTEVPDIETDLENMIAESYVKPDVERCFDDIRDQIIGTVLDEDEYFEQLFKRVTETRVDKYKTLKASEKLEVVRYAKRIGVRRIAKLMDLATGTLSGWITKYQSLLGLMLDTNTESDQNASNQSSTDLDQTVNSTHESEADMSETKETLDETYESGAENCAAQTPGRPSSILDNVEKTEVTALRFLLKDRFPLLLEKIDIARKVKFKNLIPAEKIEIVKCAKLVGIRPTARVFQMPLGTLSGWISKYSHLLEPEFQGDGHGSAYSCEWSNTSLDNSFGSFGKTDINTSTPLKVAPHLQWTSKAEQNENPISPYSKMMNEMAEKSFSSAADLYTPEYQLDAFNTKTNILNRRVTVEWPKINKEVNTSLQTEMSWPKLKMPNGAEEAIKVPSESGFPNFLLQGNSAELTNDEATKIMAQQYLQQFGAIKFSS